VAYVVRDRIKHALLACTTVAIGLGGRNAGDAADTPAVA
jgi:hypothetical protein